MCATSDRFDHGDIEGPSFLVSGCCSYVHIQSGVSITDISRSLPSDIFDDETVSKDSSSSSMPPAKKPSFEPLSFTVSTGFSQLQPTFGSQTSLQEATQSPSPSSVGGGHKKKHKKNKDREKLKEKHKKKKKHKHKEHRQDL